MEKFRPIKNFTEEGEPLLVVIMSEDKPELFKPIKKALEADQAQYKLLELGKDISKENFQSLCATARTFPVVYYGDKELVGFDAIVNYNK